MPGDNIYPDLSNDKFDIKYARLMGLSSDLRASFGVEEEEGGSKNPGFGPIERDSDTDTGIIRFAVAGEDDTATQNRSFDLNGGYSFELTQLGNPVFLVDPPNGLYQLGAVPVPGSDSGLSYTYLEIDDNTNKITLQAGEGIVLPGYGYGNHSGTETFFLAVDAGGNLIEVASPSGGTVTADNGLTMSTATNVQLGSSSVSGAKLLHTTYIDVDAYELYIHTSGSSNRSMTVNGDEQAIGMYANTVATVTTSPGLPLWVIASNSSTSTVQEALVIERNPFAAAGNGIGASIDFQTATTGAGDFSNKIISQWVDATHATRTSQLDITGVNSATTQTQASFKGTGQVQFNQYGVGSFTGTPAYSLLVDSSGNIIEGSVGGGSITADNGLTMSTSTNVQLGGTLTGNTTITTTASYRLNISSSNASNPALYVLNASGNNASFGAQILSSNGVATYSQVNDGIALHTVNTPSTNNTVVNAIKIERSPDTGGGADGIGSSIDFWHQSSSNARLANKIISKFDVATDGSRTSSLTLQGVFTTSTVDLLVLAGDGSVKLRPITATEGSAITPAEGMLVMVSSTNGTFGTIGIYCYQNGAWAAL